MAKGLSADKTVVAKTKKPTGLTITRNGNKFTFAWTCATENYGAGQNLEYRTRKLNGTDWREWETVGVSPSARSVTVTLNYNNFLPFNTSAGLTGIEFRIKGMRQAYDETKDGKTIHHIPDWSDWSDKTMSLGIPSKPTVTPTTSSYTTTFAWAITTALNDGKPYTQFQWESIRADESNVSNGANLSWSSSSTGYQSGTGSAASGSVPITETTAQVASGSHTRWFRIRARGPAGASDWVYSCHTYALPNAAAVSSATATVRGTSYLMDVSWSVARSFAYPVDEASVEYAKAVPDADMSVPSSPGWTAAQTSADTRGKNRAVFTIDGLLTADQCLWVRIKTVHDGRSNYGTPKLVTYASLSNPSGVSVTASGRSATVTATNNSSAAVYTGSSTSVKRLFLAILYRGAKYYTGGYIIGIMPYGTTSINVTLPDQTNETAYSIGARAVVGTYSGTTITSGVMYSDQIWTEASVPKAPASVSASFDGEKINVSWSWSWADADSAELSWSTDPNAWGSTNEPSTYEIARKATNWSIQGVSAGNTCYIRVRLKDDATGVYGPYSSTVSLKLTVPPLKPSLVLSDGRITDTGKVTASWVYQSGDGTEQTYAEIRVKNGSSYSNPIATADSSQHITLYAEDMGWVKGSTYQLVLRVYSKSGSYSEYSDPVPIEIALIGQAEITSDSLEIVTIDEEDVNALTAMPLTLSVTGAGKSGMTEVVIERAEAYQMDRPDEDTFNGYEGETIFIDSFIGEGSLTISNENLVGCFDDGAKYRIVVTVSDDLGQSTSVSKDFIVKWSHQALMPEGTVVIDDTIAKITPSAPAGTASGDYCEIYRLSADRPELIVAHAEFGTTYVDPYPAIGDHGGYRIVFKTVNGDYITEDKRLAWLDIFETLELEDSIIDFGTGRVTLSWNMELANSWKKDFKMTKYMGGSIQGDWNAGVERNSTIKAVMVSYLEQELIRDMRRLADYPGICHVRTPDGSSYSADIQVSEDSTYDTAGKIVTFNLTITRVDPEGYDGVLLSEWEA